MSLIEQAAKRLEQLRKAGVTVPTATAESPRTETESPVQDPALQVAAQPLAESVAVAEAVSVSRVPPLVASETSTSEAGVVSRRIDLDITALAASGLITRSRYRGYRGQ